MEAYLQHILIEKYTLELENRLKRYLTSWKTKLTLGEFISGEVWQSFSYISQSTPLENWSHTYQWDTI